QIKPISIEDRTLFYEYYKQNPAKCSYLSFANLFLWKDAEDIHYFEYEKHLVATGKSIYDGKRYFMMPLGGCLCGKLKAFLDQSFGTDYHIYGITHLDVEKVRENCGAFFEIRRERDMDNYVYTAEKLRTLTGKKLHAKRNHINKFKDLYSYTYEAITPENMGKLRTFIEDWYQKKAETDRSILLEKTALENALSYFSQLELKGGMLLVEDKVVAFSIGERLNEDTALIHFEKADTDYQGAYAMINQQFVTNAWSDVAYINREDDMGIEGLRKAKLSYYPDMMVEMYSATPK
ncbi:MAG: DUF2156 domain-containing protein, partial [Clostridia bacterium]|nr:DUF2156 domain-containing protein [Clostridia bacterium]